MTNPIHSSLPPMLSGHELVDWKALSRVHAGAVVRSGGEYLDGGAPMPRYLLPELLYDMLLRVGLITLAWVAVLADTAIVSAVKARRVVTRPWSWPGRSI